MTNSTEPRASIVAPARVTFISGGGARLSLSRADILDLAGDTNAPTVELFGATFYRAPDARLG